MDKTAENNDKFASDNEDQHGLLGGERKSNDSGN